MLRLRDFLVFVDISTFGLNGESRTRNIPACTEANKKR